MELYKNSINGINVYVYQLENENYAEIGIMNLEKR